MLTTDKPEIKDPSVDVIFSIIMCIPLCKNLGHPTNIFEIILLSAVCYEE